MPQHAAADAGIRLDAHPGSAGLPQVQRHRVVGDRRAGCRVDQQRGVISGGQAELGAALAEPLQLAMDNGAKRALIPLENKRSFLEVTGDVVEHVDPIFFGDPKTAAFKALGLN